jgi:DNA (cytosine-5)-methyltransferase 1
MLVVWNSIYIFTYGGGIMELSNSLTHLDLFSGIGGFSLAAKWAEIDTVQFVEIDKFCQRVLKKNFPNIPCHDDIKTFNYNKKVDLLTGGFPCQPFSIAGSKKGVMDERYLWPEMFRIIRQSKPTWIIAENVLGIVNYIEPILYDLESENYQFEIFNIPASCIGAPHKRERIFIVAHNNSKRLNNGIDNRKRRYIQDYIEQHISEIQQEWQKFIPQSWKANDCEKWFQYNADCSRENNGFSDWMDRIKSIGNAVVPQIPYLFMKVIKLIEDKS